MSNDRLKNIGMAYISEMYTIHLEKTVTKAVNTILKKAFEESALNNPTPFCMIDLRYLEPFHLPYNNYPATLRFLEPYTNERLYNDLYTSLKAKFPESVVTLDPLFLYIKVEWS